MKANLKFNRKTRPTVFESFEVSIKGNPETVENIMKAIRQSAVTQGFKEE